MGCNLGTKSWRILLVLPLCWQALAIERDQPASSASPGATRQHLRSALQASDKNDIQGAQSQVLAVIYDPLFASLEPADQHAALALAARLDLQTKDFEHAQQFAVRATQMPEQTVDDWRNRLTASAQLADASDEAECLTVIVHRWGRDPNTLSDASVRRVLGETNKAEAAEARFELLEALYEMRWAPADGGTSSRLWSELSRLLLERNRKDEAIQVAALVDEPRDIIAFHADLRFHPLLKSDSVRSNPRRAAQEQIKALRERVRQRPRSLAALHELIYALLKSRQDVDALALAEEADKRIGAAVAGVSPYDDMGRYGFVLDSRSTALRHMERFEEAVQQFRRAVDLPKKTDTVSQPIDFALFLCELDRPDEALAVVPDYGKASRYGDMLIALVHLTAAIERDSRADADQALAYLREHRADSVETLQDGLVRAGDLDEAEQLFLSRLNNPLQRTSALVEAQNYFDRKRPPRAQQWRERYRALKARPAVRAAISQFGEIDGYAWTYGFD